MIHLRVLSIPIQHVHNLPRVINSVLSYNYYKIYVLYNAHAWVELFRA